MTWSTTSNTVSGRVAGFQIGSTGDPDADYDVTYHYDAAGRIARIVGPGLPAYGVEYSRLTDSDLVEYARYKSDASTTLATIRRSYEADRDLIDYVQNDTSGTVSKYDYENDALGRRVNVVYTGSAFSQNHLFLWGYNPRSELIAADRHQGTDPGSPGTQYGTNGAFDYAYDPIGNRESYQLDGGTATTYTANNLNQYTATANPTEYFCYDADGNLIADGKPTSDCNTANGAWKYTWDGENRLIRVEPAGTPTSGDKKLEFQYDYRSRRVRKASYTHNGSAWVEDADLLFVYDKWNVVLVLNANASNATIRRYTWGLDLSGLLGNASISGIHNAGGIGGLLAIEDVGAGGGSVNSYWYCYDANGNVGQLIKASDRSLAAHYEYDPYGNTITATGFYAAANPWRFSTKWHDTDLPGNVLIYYGYRYYSPRLGRWLNRDPIEELGGLNLYLYMYNRVNNAAELWGLGFWDFIDCMADCIEDNDPIELAIAKALAMLAGVPLPKSFVASLAELVGDTTLARRIRGGSPFTTIPSVISTKLRLGGRSALRALGRYAAPAVVAYGLALAAIETHCLGWCCGTDHYTSDGNILNEIKRRFF